MNNQKNCGHCDDDLEVSTLYKQNHCHIFPHLVPFSMIVYFKRFGLDGFFLFIFFFLFFNCSMIIASIIFAYFYHGSSCKSHYMRRFHPTCIDMCRDCTFDSAAKRSMNLFAGAPSTNAEI